MNSSGNIGIGTSSPSVKLQINYTGRFGPGLIEHTERIIITSDGKVYINPVKKQTRRKMSKNRKNGKTI